MKRLLCIVGGMNAGGAETFLMKIYRNLDKTQYQMDFAVAIEGDGLYDREIKALGGKIHHITPKSKSIVKNFSDIIKLVKKEQYKYVLRVSQNSLSALELLAAWFGGAKIRVFRSSNSNTGSDSKKELLMHTFCRFMPKRFANVRIAPSTEAAEFMFGKGCIQKGSATIIHNAVDLSVYQYDPISRRNIRQELNLPNTAFLVGHIGRFCKQKNHVFLLEVFKSIRNKNENAYLVLVGKGELENDIRELVAKYGLENCVLFTGVRTDIPALLSAMDVFVFPSFYEGMPNTVIEAQGTGLPCVIADTITADAKLISSLKFLSLSDSADEWAEVSLSSLEEERQDTKQAFIMNKYDIESSAKDFVNVIFHHDNRS